jgi:predicted  nucleic acid-binding Zn-ribbon protein
MSKKPQAQNDSSNTLDIQDIQNQYQDSTLKIQVEGYQKRNVELFQRIQDLEDTLKAKEDEITHLKALLDSSVPSYTPSFVVNDEEVIAIKQLELLKQASQIRPLSLEEVRIYDLLVKNKRLAQGDSTNIVDTVKLPKDKAQLIKIASRKVTDGEER